MTTFHETIHMRYHIFSRFTCPEKTVLLCSSFRAVPFFFFFADLRKNIGFYLAESLLFFLLESAKKNRSKRTDEKNRCFGTCKPAICHIKI